MGVPRYTTPTFTLTFTEQTLDLTHAEKVFVTFQGNGVNFTKDGEDLSVEEKKIDVFLSQEESGSLPDGPVRVQANWMNPDGRRYASTIATVMVSPNLLKKVIT